MELVKGKQRIQTKSLPFFYLADTCWSAFTNITEADWDYYLNYRKQQGFNVIQVNLLWQWDASETELNLLPFAVKADGTFDFNQRNEPYFERAERMVAKAYEKGITIALVLLWANYLPDTWATKLRATSIFPMKKINDYVTDTVQRFAKYAPIYIISGDTDFPTEKVIDYYELALNKVKELDPNGLTTLHIQGRASELPERLQNNKNLDFYMYQSGHNRDYQSTAYKLAQIFAAKEPKRPVINGEPCYEMMGYSRKVYGRFNRFDVRKAAWQSILSGATAGITYGAHGIWSWHSEKLGFDSNVGEAFDTPYDWHDALQFEGAWDYSFIKKIVEEYALFDISPLDVVKNNTEEIRVAENDEFVVVYMPTNINLKLVGNYCDLKNKVIDLHSKKETELSLVYDSKKNETTFNMHRFIEDVLLLIWK